MVSEISSVCKTLQPQQSKPTALKLKPCNPGTLKPCNPPTLKLSKPQPSKKAPRKKHVCTAFSSPFWSVALWRASRAARHLSKPLVIARIRGHVIAVDTERLAKSRGKFGIWLFATIAMHSYCECLLQCTVIVNVYRKTCKRMQRRLMHKELKQLL